MKNKLFEWLSIQRAKNPGKVILASILIFNLLFLIAAALIISSFSLTGTENMSFFEAAFCTITMILDAGCVQFVIEDIGQASVAVSLFCLAVIFVGMISFTGAVIGYITNYISNFIENANTGNNKLRLSEHIVILNWNTRASEIINDLLYSDEREKIVVLVPGRRSEIEKEIEERLSDTIIRENKAISDSLGIANPVIRYFKLKKQRFKNRLTVIVREGDVFSSKQLHDIKLEYAKTVIILGNDINNTVCKYEQKDTADLMSRGNTQTVKTLMQVSDITGDQRSRDKQKIIVEITDDWTGYLVSRIIKSKEVAGKCNIIPVLVNKVLGQILSQFSLMPELNLAYKELFSNKGAAFYTVNTDFREDDVFITEYLENHRHAIPLTFMINKKDNLAYAYFTANHEKDVFRKSPKTPLGYSVDCNSNFWLEKKHVVILGHNSKCRDIMQGFEAFVGEWQYKDSDEDILDIMVIDDRASLEKLNYYSDYKFVKKTVEASIYDREIICSEIENFVSRYAEDTSVLILSDDSALNENIDANALANLVYVQDIINAKVASDPDFDRESIDIVVEIIDPKHHDIVNSYSVNNVVISNRYISKMITQIGEKEALYDFYCDILTYDSSDAEVFESKEIYVKKVSSFFKEIPKKCSAADFIRAVYRATSDINLPVELRNPTIVLGYVSPGSRMVLFDGNQNDIEIELTEKDKLIVFSNH